MNYKLLFIIIAFSCSFHSYSKQSESLKQQINSLLEGKNATVGVAILAGDGSEYISINGNKKLPMQSVFKYQLALAVLDQVDKNNLSLSDRISISPKDLDNNLWSPIRKEYPDGANLSLAEVLKYTVAYSDNVGCDILFNIVGGTKVVEAYLHKQGIMDVAIEYDEITQQLVWDRMYENWTTANAAIAVLKLFYENKEHLLSQNSHQFLWDTMKISGTGKDKIKGLLPKGTIVAHKTGSSGRNKLGLTGAENDIGIVFLPDGTHFYISVLVSNSTEKSAVNKKLIADVSKVTWDYFKK
ncbi:class A beta-lactamase, subclass A2 [Colwellia sp. 20A7]|uniref:class A beta-lactamase, subclass A2 n=1 Tax=Colwellia sp. 20A7 TaxID=2689569 RepID=UPI00135727ED|nr:class A beta-lactamase, subclass A2 [Colwellia sp. 20A7]